MVKTKLTVTVNVYVCSRGSNGTVPVSFSFTPAQSKLKLKANTVTVYRGETVVVPVTTTPSGAQLSSLYVSGTKPAGITVLPLADSKTVKITAASSVQPGTYSVILKGKAYGAATDSEYVALVLKIAVKK